MKRASLLRRDSVHGTFRGSISIDHENEAIIPLGTSDSHSDTDMIRHTHKNAIITEADNPKAHRSE